MLMPVSNISPSQTHHQCSDDTSTSGAYRMAGNSYGGCLHHRNWKALPVRRKNKGVHQRIEHWHVPTLASKYATFTNPITFRNARRQSVRLTFIRRTDD